MARSGSRTGRHVTLAGAAALLIAAASCGSGSSHRTVPTTVAPGGANSGSTTTSAPAAAEAACNLPLTHDTDNGFHIAVPGGWDLSTLNGEILVENNPTATEAVLVYPALQTSGLTPAGFFNSYLSSLEKQAGAAGHPVVARSQPAQAGMPVDSISGTEGTQHVTGIATVRRIPLHTQNASAELVFESYWAPPSLLASQQAMLASIGACYGPETASLFRVFKDQVFTYIMPPGWTVNDESQNNIDLHLGSAADVSYVLLESILSSQVDSPQGLISFVLGKDGFTGVHSRWTDSTPPKQETAGTQGIAYEEFTANLGSLSDHGLIYALTDTGGGVTSGVVRLALSTAGEWNSLNGAMIQMAGAIQHDFTQDLQQLQQVNREFQDFSGQVANFDDTLNNQQLVQDPSTGNFYEAPYSAYIVDGAGGPGYYLPNGQRLNEIQRP
jgi:hypothetical protein